MGEKRTVLITGCSSGIGRETARTFRQRGWEVFATDPDPASMADLRELGCTTAELDVTEPGDAETVVERILDHHGSVDCLVNNAGYGQIGPLEELSTDLLRRQFEVNFFGQHRLVRAVLPAMRRRGSGTIINVSSVYGRTVFVGVGAYSSSKWAVEAMSDTLRAEVSDYDIDVTIIEPGPVETEFGKRALDEKANLERRGAYDWFYTLFDGRRYDRRFIDKGPGYVQPQRVATVIADAASSDSPDRRYVVGPWKYAMLIGRFVPTAVRDRLFELLKKLP